MATALTIATFDASAADTSSATSAAASPPNPAPLDAPAPTTPMTPSSNPIAYLPLNTCLYRRHAPALIS